MKKILLFFAITTSSFLSAQILQNENFNSLTIGNVGIDFVGFIAGQGGWYTTSSNGNAPTTATNAGTSNYQIVAEGIGGTKGLKIVTSNGNNGSRLMSKENLPSLWLTRTVGNNIIEIEYDMYTGPASTSKTQVGVNLYGYDGPTYKLLNGFIYNMDTRELNGIAYLNNAGTLDTYLIDLSPAPGLILTADTWYRIGFAYDTTTGAVTWKTPTVYSGLSAAYWTGPFPLFDVHFGSFTPATNTAAADIIFDGLTVKATLVEALLDVNQVVEINDFSVFPNPVNNVVSISSATNNAIKSIEIIDFNGRTIKSVKTDNVTNVEVNVSDLAQGVYTMKIASDNGNVIKKIIKQ